MSLSALPAPRHTWPIRAVTSLLLAAVLLGILTGSQSVTAETLPPLVPSVIFGANQTVDVAASGSAASNADSASTLGSVRDNATIAYMGAPLDTHAPLSPIQAAVLWSPLVICAVAVLTGGAVSAEVFDAHRAAATLALSVARTVTTSRSGGVASAVLATFALYPVRISSTSDLRVAMILFGVVLPFFCVIGSVAILSWRVARRASIIATALAAGAAATGGPQLLSPMAGAAAHRSPPRPASVAARSFLTSPLISLISWINAAVVAYIDRRSAPAPSPPLPPGVAPVGSEHAASGGGKPMGLTIIIPSPMPPPPPPRLVLTVRAVVALACTSASFACYSVVSSAVFLVSAPQATRRDVASGAAALCVTSAVYAALARACWAAAHRNRATGSPLGSVSVLSWSDSAYHTVVSTLRALLRAITPAARRDPRGPGGPVGSSQNAAAGASGAGRDRFTIAVPTIPGQQPGPPVGGAAASVVPSSALCSDMRAFRLRVFRWDNSERRGGSLWDGPRAAFYFTSFLTAFGAAALAGAAQSATQRELANGRFKTATHHHRGHAIGILICHLTQLVATVTLRPFRSRRQAVFAIMSAAAAVAGAAAAVAFGAIDDPTHPGSWRHSDLPALIAALPSWMFSAYALFALMWYQFVTRTSLGADLLLQWRAATDAATADAARSAGQLSQRDSSTAGVDSATPPPSLFAVFKRMLFAKQGAEQSGKTGADDAVPGPKITVDDFGPAFGRTPTIVFQEHAFEEAIRDADAAAEEIMRQYRLDGSSSRVPMTTTQVIPRAENAETLGLPPLGQGVRWRPSPEPSAQRTRGGDGKDASGRRAFVTDDDAASAGIERDLVEFVRDSLSQQRRRQQPDPPKGANSSVSDIVQIPVRWPLQRSHEHAVTSPLLANPHQTDGGFAGRAEHDCTPTRQQRDHSDDVSSASSSDDESGPVFSAARGEYLSLSAPRRSVPSPQPSAARSRHTSTVRRRGDPLAASTSVSRQRGLLGHGTGVVNPLSELSTVLPGADWPNTPQHGSLRQSSLPHQSQQRLRVVDSPVVQSRRASAEPDPDANFYYDPLKAQMREVLGSAGPTPRYSVAAPPVDAVSPARQPVAAEPSPSPSVQRAAPQQSEPRAPTLPIMDGFVDDLADLV